MRPSIADMLRAYLIPASLAAAATELAAVLAFLLFRLSTESFHTISFRAGAACVIVAAVVVTRRRAYCAFRLALQKRYVCYHDTNGKTLYVSPACPQREWVILHLHFHRIAFHLARLDGQLVMPVRPANARPFAIRLR